MDKLVQIKILVFNLFRGYLLDGIENKIVRKINLKAKEFSNQNKRRKKSSGVIPLVLGLVIFLIAGVLSGGVYYMKKTQKEEIAKIKMSLKEMKDSLDSSAVYRDVYDFQDRLLELKDVIIKKKVVQSNLLNQISELTMNEGEVQNLSVKMSGGVSEVSIGLLLGSFEELAKQLDSYNKININKQAALSSGALKEGGVLADVTFLVDNISVQPDNMANGQ